MESHASQQNAAASAVGSVNPPASEAWEPAVGAVSRTADEGTAEGGLTDEELLERAIRESLEEDTRGA